ncbi:MAG: hypothetical protein D6795_16810 [Deltaproteobacteria bacterium]|nr:MAG: hypothetical protein D6795_16810 [Deltaproteobacteria bacterium]
MASDRILSSEGWYVDDVEVTDGSWQNVVAQTAPGTTSLTWRLPEVESDAACFRISMMAGECESTPGVRSAPFVILSGDPQDADGDGDGVPDLHDDCPEDANPDQADADGDGAGDVCDPCPADNPDDPDGDGVCQGSDNCPEDANPDQADADGDGLGDPCDPEVTCALFPGFFPDRYARCAMILLLLVSPFLLGVSRRTRPPCH